MKKSTSSGASCLGLDKEPETGIRIRIYYMKSQILIVYRFYLLFFKNK